ncbi:MAG: glycosyltransferase family 4 protein, partial [Chloroflexota bacterium]
GLLFTCQADRAIWRRLVRWSALHQWVIPLAADEDLFRPRSAGERRAARARHGLPPDAPLLFSVGRLNIQKNLHSLLRLLATVRPEVPEAYLCFAGEEDDIVLGEFGVRNTGYVSALHTLAAELGVAGAISFVGPVFGEDLARLYAAADVAVSASFYHRENFGLAQVEAQACGVPVVCSSWGGFKDVVRHGETGFYMDAVLTRHGIRVDWATGARYVLTLLVDSERRARMGKQAAAWARERFSVAALSQALARVVAEAGHPPDAAPGAGPAYEPSESARRYEAHKRACGWYAPSPRAHNAASHTPWPLPETAPSLRTPKSAPAGTPRAYRPMFQGREYHLYERMMAPYATRLARALQPDDISPDWTPYFPSPVTLAPIRMLAEAHDPVWPHRRVFRDPVSWAVLSHIDGAATVAEIAAAVEAEYSAADRATIIAALWRLHVDGFILFTGVIELPVAQ